MDGEWFNEQIESTFAVYRGGPEWQAKLKGACLRGDYPCVARHLPWYLDSAHLPEEEQYYLAHADRRFAHWGFPAPTLADEEVFVDA